MSNISYINGFYKPIKKAFISINDRSFHFSDAVYEVIPVYNKKLIYWEKHIKRLKNSINLMAIKYNLNEKILAIKCNEIINRNNLVEGIIYLHISRGTAPRNHNWSEDLKPSLIISCLHKPIYSKSRNLISLISSNDIRWEKCDIKSVSLLANVLLKQKAKKNKSIECIMVDNNGYVTEATTSNVMIIKNDTIITRPLSSKILAGVTRDVILHFARKLNIPFKVKKFKIEDIFQAQSTFLTNSSSFMMEAKILNKKRLNIDNSNIIRTIKSEYYKELIK